MSTETYRAIIAAIDQAILAGVARPGIIKAGDREVQYRNLSELKDIRAMYVRLVNAANGSRGFRISKIRQGGSV